MKSLVFPLGVQSRPAAVVCVFSKLKSTALGGASAGGEEGRKRGIARAGARIYILFLTDFEFVQWKRGR